MKMIKYGKLHKVQKEASSYIMAWSDNLDFKNLLH